MNKKIKLIDGYYIRKFDNKNWVIGKMLVTEKGKHIGNEYEKIEGYYGSIQHAWNRSVDFLSLKQESFPEVLQMLETMKSIKIEKKAALNQ